MIKIYDYKKRYRDVAEQCKKSVSEITEERKMAIIKGVGYGNRDVGYPVLYFSVFLNENVGSLQIVGKEDAWNLVRDYGVYDVKDMEGKPIWVYQCGNLIMWIESCLIR